MKQVITIFICIWSLSISVVKAQSIEVDYLSKPLNEILVEWREQYNLQFSFNDALLANYKISIKQSFKSTDEALKTILKGLPLDFEKNDEVYIIFPLKKEKKPKHYTLVGKIIEKGSGEPLPFSHIMANGQQSVTDIKGVFSFNFSDDSVYQIKASHLGCYILDTTLVAGNGHTLVLNPSAVGIKEVVVTNNIVEKATQIGEESGLTSLNHHIANYLPGNGDNSVFNLLRLQPGILAAGEQPNDLIIWGGPEGTSRVTFDGFTIWGLKNFNDNISAVNPYMAKNIEVHKGGYGASNDDVVGGIVRITGKNGSTIKPGVNLFLNNQTLNGMVELPMNKKSSLMLAFRQTYYNLFGSEDIEYPNNMMIGSDNITETPAYDFRDFNVKYSLQGDNGDLFYMSMLYGADNFELDVDRQFKRENKQGQEVDTNVNHEQEEDNKQIGSTVFYGKTWSNGHSSSLKASYSALKSNYSLRREDSSARRNVNLVKRDDNAQNDVSEVSVNWENNLLAGEKQTITVGLEWINNDLVLTEDSFGIEYINLSERANRLALYVQDRFRINQRLSLTAGLRYNHSFFVNKVYFDPRLSLSFRASGNIKLNASWGRYHQFVVKSSIDDEDGNYLYTWTLADNDEVPVLSSTHYVLGGAYTRQKFLFSIDTYFKENDGLTRFIRYRQNDFIFYGDSRSYGVDLYVKQDFKGHSIWASYSLGKTEEHFSYFEEDGYRRSSQDQRHEVKVAGLFNIGSFHLSASYIYGSGFPFFKSFQDYVNQRYTEPNYNRLDASLVYRLSSQKFSGEVGISVLNVTDVYNIKYNQFSRIPKDQTNSVFINSEAVPFTPLLYLKLSF
ncbi:TonB-dependent receptor domain-containing protein [Carboxylicivirga marina]|uniref:TonB-dependent receptor domain-containing protein n=1 Tax=Carboxylicivirga marina TaxID=2800988 RepID=UPI002594E317|nr:TonB-dependent receptor [Carboxylicivirga marina]